MPRTVTVAPSLRGASESGPALAPPRQAAFSCERFARAGSRGTTCCCRGAARRTSSSVTVPTWPGCLLRRSLPTIAPSRARAPYARTPRSACPRHTQCDAERFEHDLAQPYDFVPLDDRSMVRGEGALLTSARLGGRTELTDNEASGTRTHGKRTGPARRSTRSRPSLPLPARRDSRTSRQAADDYRCPSCSSRSASVALSPRVAVAGRLALRRAVAVAASGAAPNDVLEAGRAGSLPGENPEPIRRPRCGRKVTTSEDGIIVDCTASTTATESTRPAT